MGLSLWKNYWNFVKLCPGNLLEICLVGFVDTCSGIMPIDFRQTVSNPRHCVTKCSKIRTVWADVFMPQRCSPGYSAMQWAHNFVT